VIKMKNIWQTYKIPIIIFIGILFIIVGIYLNSLILAEMREESFSSPYPVFEQPQVLQADHDEPQHSGTHAVFEEKDHKAKGQLPGDSHNESADILILVN